MECRNSVFSFPLLIASSVVTACLLVDPVLAACPFRADDLVGRWQSYSIDVINGGWIQCDLTVLSNGLLRTGVRCTTSLGDATTVTNGFARLNRTTCTVTGSIELRNGATAKLTNGVFIKDKSLIQGVGVGNGGSRPFFSFIRQ
jgi:hypothetical protein